MIIIHHQLAYAKCILQKFLKVYELFTLEGNPSVDTNLLLWYDNIKLGKKVCFGKTTKFSKILMIFERYFHGVFHGISGKELKVNYGKAEHQRKRENAVSL